MNQLAVATTLVVLGSMHETSMAVDGPSAPYNEAVKIVNGERVVEVAPFPSHMQFAVGNFKRPDEHAPMMGDLAAIETPQGLMDCARTLWFHPKACSPSTFGKEKHFRTWIVMMKGGWFACESHTSANTCVPIIADGKLRPVPSAQE